MSVMRAGLSLLAIIALTVALWFVLSVMGIIAKVVFSGIWN